MMLIRARKFISSNRLKQIEAFIANINLTFYEDKINVKKSLMKYNNFLIINIFH